MKRYYDNPRAAYLINFNQLIPVVLIGEISKPGKGLQYIAEQNGKQWTIKANLIKSSK